MDVLPSVWHIKDVTLRPEWHHIDQGFPSGSQSGDPSTLQFNVTNFQQGTEIIIYIKNNDLEIHTHTHTCEKEEDFPQHWNKMAEYRNTRPADAQL